jgi:hypothetical protein
VLLAATKPKRTDDGEALPPHTFELLKGRRVDVVANGFSYQGTLVGADESDLYLKGDLRWLVLPLATVRSVKEAPVKERPLGTSAPGFADPGDDE